MSRYDQSAIMAALENAASETFESMTFLAVCIDATACTFDGRGKSYWSTIDFDTPIRGSLTLIVPEDLAHEATCNLFGNTGSCELSDKVIDAIGEMNNTIVGSFLRTLTHAEEPFHLGLPENGIGVYTAGEATYQTGFVTDTEQGFCVQLTLLD